MGSPGVPWTTVALLVGAVVVFLWGAPGAQSPLLFRGSITSGGVTLWTTHLVHFTLAHLWWDALMIAVAGIFVERRMGSGPLLLGLCGAAPVIGMCVATVHPELAGYGGLSGIACFYAACALNQWTSAETNSDRLLPRLIWLGAVGKVVWEVVQPGGNAIFAGALSNSQHSVVVVPAAHAAGLECGWIFAQLSSRKCFCSSSRCWSVRRFQRLVSSCLSRVSR